MALEDELLNLRRELASAGSPLQRMKMLARSWRTLRQLSPAERRQLATAVGADGAEDILDKLAAHKGRVGSAFLVPAVEKLKDMDPDALGRLVEALRDPDQRRELMRKGARAVGDVLVEEPAAAAEEEPTADDEFEVEDEPVAKQEAVERPEIAAVSVIEEQAEPATPAEIAGAPVPEPDEPARDEQLPEIPTAEPPSRPPVVTPLDPVVPPALARDERRTRQPAPITLQPSAEAPAIEHVRGAPTLLRRLALAREALQGAEGWNVDQLRALIEVFPQDWARRRVLVDMLRHGIPADPAQAIDLVQSLESRASRRWCVSLLLHEWQLSESERQELRERI